MPGDDGGHVSRLCATTWATYAAPAGDAAWALLIEARECVSTGTCAVMIDRRLDALDDALAEMLVWLHAGSEARRNGTRDGVRAFERWHRAYHAAVAAVILCDACGQLNLGGSRLAAPYAAWKKAHQALRVALGGSSNGDPALAERLVDQLPFRRQLAEAGERSPMPYPAPRAPRRRVGTGAGGVNEEMPCFLNGARTRFIREALRGLEEDLPEESRVSPVREALERLRASDRLTASQLEILEDFVAELSSEAEPGRTWYLQQRLKSIERDLASQA